MTFCDSARGEWGKRCPDCGQTLPPPPRPLTTWMAARPGEWPGAITERRWSPEARRSRESAFAARRGRTTERMAEIVRIVEKHGGNRNAAARELGVSAPTVFATLRRARAVGLRVPDR